MMRNGRKYTCSIPNPQASGSLEQKAGVKKTEAELLAPVEKTCMYKMEGWWTYEFCFGQHLRQFHQDGRQIVQDYVLGRYNRAASDEAVAAAEVKWAQTSQRSGPGKEDQRREFYPQRYTDGTECDVTGMRRETQVQLACGPAPSIGVVKEPASCKYVATIYTPALCAHPAYAVTDPRTNEINCVPAEPPPSDSAGLPAALAALLPAAEKGLQLASGDSAESVTVDGHAAAERAAAAAHSADDQGAARGLAAVKQHFVELLRRQGILTEDLDETPGAAVDAGDTAREDAQRVARIAPNLQAAAAEAVKKLVEAQRAAAFKRDAKAAAVTGGEEDEEDEEDEEEDEEAEGDNEDEDEEDGGAAGAEGDDQDTGVEQQLVFIINGRTLTIEQLREMAEDGTITLLADDTAEMDVVDDDDETQDEDDDDAE